MGIALNTDQEQALSIVLSNSVSIFRRAWNRENNHYPCPYGSSINAGGTLDLGRPNRSCDQTNDKRLEEKQTIHRLLAYNGHTRNFQHNEEHSRACHYYRRSKHAGYLAIMLYQCNIRRLSSYIGWRCRSASQRRSGQVLKDLIDSQSLPVA